MTKTEQFLQDIHIRATIDGKWVSSNLNELFDKGEVAQIMFWLGERSVHINYYSDLVYSIPRWTKEKIVAVIKDMEKHGLIIYRLKEQDETNDVS